MDYCGLQRYNDNLMLEGMMDYCGLQRYNDSLMTGGDRNCGL